MGLKGYLGREKVAKKIFDLRVGEQGVICPDAIELDLKGRAYLNTKYPVFFNQKDPNFLPITRTGPNLKDYDIEISKTNHYFTSGRILFGKYFLNIALPPFIVELKDDLDDITDKEIEWLNDPKFLDNNPKSNPEP